MCCLGFRCHECGFQRFVFTRHCRIKQTRHGAACAKCGEMVTQASCFNGAASTLLNTRQIIKAK